ncbi:hypothetical protein [Natronorubrum tibetense]|nr:hypothetical protein [Natronorubrum tibetense]
MVGVGAVYSTGAFSSVNAGRGVGVSAAEAEDEALLGIKNINSTDEPVFENNTSLHMEVELTDIDPDTTVTFDPSEFSLSPDDEETVAIETEGDSTSAEVAVTATLFDDGNETGQITLRRDFSVPQAEQTELTGDVTSTGGSGRFAFTLTNEGDTGVELVAIGIREATGPLERVDDGDLLLDTSGTGQGDRVVDDAANEIPVDDETFISFDPTQSLSPSGSPDDSIELRFDKFNDDPRGETVTIEIEFPDGTGEYVLEVPE